MSDLFHVAPAGLPVGLELPHGRFGAALRTFRPHSPTPPASSFPTYMWEMALETARRQNALNAPSRLDCLFACETAEAARAFRDRYRNGSGIYRIEVIGGASTHRGDFSIFTTGPFAGAFLDFMPEIARRYWTEAPSGLVEVLVGGPVRIVEPIAEA